MSRRRCVGRFAVVATVLLAACDGGSRDDNLAIVDRFPDLVGVRPVSTDTRGYCRGDRCPLGDDGVGTLVIFDVTPPITDDEVVDAFAAVFDDWVMERDRECLAAADECTEPSDLMLVASLTDGEALIAFNFDNWPTRFEVYVDAHRS